MPGSNTHRESTLIDALKAVFGFQAFRPNQESIITSILDWPGCVCGNAYRGREIPVLSAAGYRDAWYCGCDQSSYLFDERPGGCRG